VPVTRGPNGEIAAPTKLHGTAPNGILRATAGNVAWRVENVDICCSRGTGSSEGRGINRNGLRLALTLSNSRVHGNQQNGVTGDAGTVLDNVELDHNGDWTAHAGRAAGFKTISDVTVRNSYIHHNDGAGMWWDCDATGGLIENSLITDNRNSGIWVEINSGLGRGFTIRGNRVYRNNTVREFGRAGIMVTSSRNVLIEGNTTAGNGRFGLWVRNDFRSTQGHNGCDSGFTIQNVVERSNATPDGKLIE